jgi:predicted 3-demethylubiquinone-9 3-methyltransferase (glyoxalase superfamily)
MNFVVDTWAMKISTCFFSDHLGSLAVNFYSTTAPSSGLIKQVHKRPKYSLTKPKVLGKNFTVFLSFAM